MLRLDNLCVSTEDGQDILKDVSLRAGAGEIHAIMGPNGAGKSTLCHVLAGRSDYRVVSGSATLEGRDILDLAPEERAALGIFLSFQYPVEVPGVPVTHFVRAAINAQRRVRGQDDIPVTDFLRQAKSVADKLDIDMAMLKRAVNVGFSGGEKKRLEIFQMFMLDPSCLILDETDSGLDIDALRLVAASVESLRSPKRTMLVVTHYQRLLAHLRPDRVHVLIDGAITASGGPELAERLERDGYESFATPALVPS